MCLLFESNKTICKVYFKQKNKKKLQIVRLKHIDIFKSFDFICLWFVFFKELIGGAKALPDPKESKKSNVDLDAKNIGYRKPAARRSAFRNPYDYDD